MFVAAREGYLAGTMALGVLGVVLAVYLCCGAGHKPGTEEIYLNWFHRIPGDVLLFLLFWGAAGSTALGAAIVANAYGDLPMFMQLIGVGLFKTIKTGSPMYTLFIIIFISHQSTIWKAL